MLHVARTARCGAMAADVRGSEQDKRARMMSKPLYVEENSAGGGDGISVHSESVAVARPKRLSLNRMASPLSPGPTRTVKIDDRYGSLVSAEGDSLAEGRRCECPSPLARAHVRAASNPALALGAAGAPGSLGSMSLALVVRGGACPSRAGDELLSVSGATSCRRSCSASRAATRIRLQTGMGESRGRGRESVTTIGLQAPVSIQHPWGTK